MCLGVMPCILLPLHDTIKYTGKAPNLPARFSDHTACLVTAYRAKWL